MEQNSPGKLRSLWARVRQSIKDASPQSRRVWLIIEFIVFATLTSLLVSRIPWTSIPEYEVGVTARMDIVTPVELIVIDPERTERLRQEEAQKVPPVFRFDYRAVEGAIGQLRSAFAQTRDQFLTALEANYKRRQLTARGVASAQFSQFVRSFERNKTAFPVGLDLAQVWALGGSGEEFQGRLISKLRGVMGYIRSDALPPGLSVAPLQVRMVSVIGEDVTPEEVEQSPIVDWSNIYTLAQARSELLKSLAPDERFYGEYLAALLNENCFYDDALTHQLRAKVSGQNAVTNRYSPRQVIVQRGQIITPQIKAAIDQLRAQTARKHSGRRFIGLILVSLILYFALWRFANRTKVFSLSPFKVFTLAGCTLVLQLAVVRLGVEIADITGYQFFGDVDTPQAYQYAIPFAMVALVAVLLLESRIAVFVGTLVSLFTLLLTEDAALSTYAAVSGLIAVFGVGRYQQRGAITKVGAMIGGVNGVMAVVLMMVKIQPLVFGPAVFSMFCGLLGGFLAAALASYALPLGESVFDILTDVKLLELSNVDLPLLRQLAIEAPGTYQHSFIVAALAEAAAKAIGANSLLVRIGSYYHDTGKLVSPQMYVENQQHNFNPHELMTPEESAQAIMRHVTEGIRMAQEAGLPKAVVDLIPQHHGTRRLHYFYVKAKQMAEERGEEVDESAFRYPGPKPQSIEAAIVMMADSAEASSRSLKDRSAENLNRLLSKVIESVVTDGQLDECNLRMRDLKKIRASFLQTLSNVHHQRIQYPGFTEEELAALAPVNYEAVWAETADTVSSPDSVTTGGDD
ncbi:MAG: HDIG domain-containing protein [Acidobacteria bacterium]|nr:HDIG domain-containing protein [Acidobacteriota bacterium]